MCSLNSQISPPASKHSAPIRHKSAKTLRPDKSLISSPRHRNCDPFFVGKIYGSFGRNLTCAQETWWLRVSWSTRTFNMRSPHCLISYSAHAQSVDYLRLGRVMFCRAILISPPHWVRPIKLFKICQFFSYRKPGVTYKFLKNVF